MNTLAHLSSAPATIHRPGPRRDGRRWLALCVLLAWAAQLSPLAAQSFGDFTYSSDGAAITITGYTGAGGAV